MSRHFLMAMRAGLCAGFVSLATLLLIANTSLADVFPNPSIPENSRSGSNRMNGLKRAVYMVVHDDDDPAYTLQQLESRVRPKELGTREFYATNSGGKYDIYYDPIIVDARIPLNADGTRPSDWVSQANAIATGTYGLNLNDYYMFAYDIDDTQPDPGQGWGGLSTGDRIYLQSLGQSLINHEIGHQVGADHAKAIRQLNNSDFHPYYWDKTEQTYKEYVPGVSPYTPVPFGAPSYEYGNPFDTMGNASSGDFRVREKMQDLGWLESSQVPSLNSLGDGTYKIYAHDELESVTNGNGEFGVAEGYDPNAMYGLTYTRTGKRFSTTFGSFVNDSQTIDLEYRISEDGFGADDVGLAFYLDGKLVDMDPAGGESYSNDQRLLEVGKSIEDVDFGMSTFLLDAGAIGSTPGGEDFVNDYDPPPPTIGVGSWFHFAVVGSGSDSVGNYVEVSVSTVSALNEIEGDLNQDTFVNQADLDLFVLGWLTDTSLLDSHGKYEKGDMNFDGITDLFDAWLFHEAWSGNGLGQLDLALLTGGSVPEPSSLVLLMLGVVMALPRGWRRTGRA